MPQSDVLPTWMFDAPAAIKWFHAVPRKSGIARGKPAVADAESQTELKDPLKVKRTEGKPVTRTTTTTAREGTGRLENQPSTGLELLIGI